MSAAVATSTVTFTCCEIPPRTEDRCLFTRLRLLAFEDMASTPYMV